MAEEPNTTSATTSATEVPVASQATTSATVTPPATVPSEEDWRDRRIARLSAEKYEMQRKIRELETRPAPTATASTPATEVPVVDEAEIDRRAIAKAAEIAVMREFNSQIEDMATRGREAFEDFDDKIRSTFVPMVDRSNAAEINAYNTLLAAAYKTKKGAEVLYALANDPKRAQKVLAMTPLDMMGELKDMAAQGTKIEPERRDTTRAPKPVTPVGNRGNQHDPIDPTDPERAIHLTSAEWHRRRAEQVAKQNERGGRRT